MKKWRDDNTDGYSDDDLDALNYAQERLEAELPELEPQTIADTLGDIWVDGITTDDLYEDAAVEFGILTRTSHEIIARERRRGPIS